MEIAEWIISALQQVAWLNVESVKTHIAGTILSFIAIKKLLCQGKMYKILVQNQSKLTF